MSPTLAIRSQGKPGSAPTSDSAINLLQNRVCRPGACIPFPQSQCMLHEGRAAVTILGDADAGEGVRVLA